MDESSSRCQAFLTDLEAPHRDADAYQVRLAGMTHAVQENRMHWGDETGPRP